MILIIHGVTICWVGVGGWMDGGNYTWDGMISMMTGSKNGEKNTWGNQKLATSDSCL